MVCGAMAQDTSTTQATDYRRQLIGGEWIEGGGGERESIDPFQQQAWTVISDADAADVDRAIGAARETFRSWKRMTGYARAQLLFRFADILEAEADELGRLET